jgi:hypothetical protein
MSSKSNLHTCAGLFADSVTCSSLARLEAKGDELVPAYARDSERLLNKHKMYTLLCSLDNHIHGVLTMHGVHQSAKQAN